MPIWKPPTLLARQYADNVIMKFSTWLLHLNVAFAMIATILPANADAKEDLAAAAQAEVEHTVIVPPRDWCGNGKVIDCFKTKHGLNVNALNPDAGSANRGDVCLM